MGIVWFGNYTFFFEKASAVLRDPLGLSHADFFRAGVQPPIVHYAVDYHRPSRLDEELTIEARLYGTDAARLNTGYRVIGPDGEIRITAQTIQVFIDAAGAVCCVPPRLWADCLERWRKGEFACLQA
jgi:YbgC/YbaW family acyl-CoA thioester hydrolase